MHFIQHKQFSETNVTSHTFQQTSDLKIFAECGLGPLKTLWRGTCGPRATNCPHLLKALSRMWMLSFFACCSGDTANTEAMWLGRRNVWKFCWDQRNSRI